jgi:O-acetylserine/cysteine efflux transporter
VKPLDTLAAVLAPFVWGLTFVAIKLGVQEAPPFLMTALRFTAAALPLAFFVKPPAAPARLVLAYGALIGVAQFGLLFLAVRTGMPAGLASLVVQAQVFFTLAFAAIAFGERPTPAQLAGAAISVLGMTLIGSARLQHASMGPFLLTLGAAVCWAAGNIVGKKMGRVDPLALMVWSSLVAPLPMFALSLALEPQATLAALNPPSLTLIVSVLFLAYGGTLFSYSLWARLLAHHPASAVAPFALLVPVVGMVAAGFWFGEIVSPREWTGAAIVMAGLALTMFGARLGGALKRRYA